MRIFNIEEFKLVPGTCATCTFYAPTDIDSCLVETQHEFDCISEYRTCFTKVVKAIKRVPNKPSVSRNKREGRFIKPTRLRHIGNYRRGTW